MGLSLHNGNAKRQKVSEEPSNDNDVIDRISLLPNAILCLILAYLPTKFSVATTILSKRWNNIEETNSLTNLDFDADVMVHHHQGDMGAYAHKMQCFEKFVDRILSIIDGKHLERFRLSWFQESAASRIYSWVAAVVVYNIREIDLSSSFCHSISLPPRLFACKSLVTLKLRGGFIIDLPAQVTLPNLKTLLLDSVTYLGDASFEKLISSCNVLEELRVVRQNLDLVQVVNIFAPSLKRLYLWFSVFNDQDIDIYCYKTCITAPSLEYFELNDQLTRNYSIESMPLLMEAQIDAHLRQMYGSLGYAKTILLHGRSIRSLKKSRDICLFDSVTRLELGSTQIGSWDWLILLLGGMPFLEVIVFPEGLLKLNPETLHRRKRRLRTTGKIVWKPAMSLPALPSGLEEVVIREFKGVENEMDLVKYILNQARALKQMTIYFNLGEDASPNSDLMEALTEKMLQFPRRSEACQLNFIS